MSSTKRKICPGLTWVAPKTYESRITAAGLKGEKADKKRTHQNIPNDRAAIRAHEAFRLEVTKAARSSEEWTVAEAIDAFKLTQSYGSWKSREVHTKRFRGAFGTRRLGSISTLEWQRFFAGLDLSDHYANLHLDTARLIYSHARGQGRLEGPNPTADVVRRRTLFDESARYKQVQSQERPRKALLGQDHVRVMEYVRERWPVLHAMFHVQFILCLRWGEAAALQWEDVDLDTGLIKIRRALKQGARLVLPKTKDERTTSLGPDGIAFLRAHKARMIREGWEGCRLWVFPRPPMGTGSPSHPQIFDRSQPPLPGYLIAYSWAWRCLTEAYTALDIQVVSLTHAFRHANATLAEGLAGDGMARAVQLSMAGHGERARKGYVDQSAYDELAVELAQRMDERLARVGGTQGGTRIAKLPNSRGK